MLIMKQSAKLNQLVIHEYIGKTHRFRH